MAFSLSLFFETKTDISSRVDPKTRDSPYVLLCLKMSMTSYQARQTARGLEWANILAHEAGLET